ncbi:MAG TPA: phosphoglycerate kinase [Alphaproteobacteria bacterium]|nr:phosphoglycerate kinase [Alphaproteobacteria bacterium]
MPEFATLDQLRARGKRVLVRVDLNVPMKDGRVTDKTRIQRAAVTLKELADQGAKLVVLSHFGRPKGKDPTLSLKPLVEPLSELLERPVRFAPDCIGPEAEAIVNALKEGEVALLENLRFHAGEEKNDPQFTQALARLGDLYVNDAFSAAHRAHASTEGLAHKLPTAAGRLMQAELDHLARALEDPQRPVAAIVGGAKVSTKIDLLTNLVAKVDALAIGGGMANTFLFARGVGIGKSLAERDLAETARQVEARARTAGCRILLPEDAVVAAELKPGARTRTVAISAVPEDQMILDIGPATVAAVENLLGQSRTLVWNGPMGAFETPPFEKGTLAVARKAAELTDAQRLLSVAGGGDTVAALALAGVEGRFSYVSTAGGAFLEWLEGKKLPGVAALALNKAGGH